MSLFGSNFSINAPETAKTWQKRPMTSAELAQITQQTGTAPVQHPDGSWWLADGSAPIARKPLTNDIVSVSPDGKTHTFYTGKQAGQTEDQGPSLAKSLLTWGPLILGGGYAAGSAFGGGGVPAAAGGGGGGAASTAPAGIGVGPAGVIGSGVAPVASTAAVGSIPNWLNVLGLGSNVGGGILSSIMGNSQANASRAEQAREFQAQLDQQQKQFESQKALDSTQLNPYTQLGDTQRQALLGALVSHYSPVQYNATGSKGEFTGGLNNLSAIMQQLAPYTGQAPMTQAQGAFNQTVNNATGGRYQPPVYPVGNSGVGPTGGGSAAAALAQRLAQLQQQQGNQ